MNGALLVVVLLVVAGLGTASVRRVPEGHAGVVERLGRFQRLTGPGTVFVLAGIERVRARIDLRSQVVQVDGEQVAASVTYRVADARTAAYAVGNTRFAVEQLVAVVARNLDGTGADRAAAGATMRRELARAGTALGLRFDGVRITRLGPAGTGVDGSGAVREDPRR